MAKVDTVKLYDGQNNPIIVNKTDEAAYIKRGFSASCKKQDVPPVDPNQKKPETPVTPPAQDTADGKPTDADTVSAIKDYAAEKGIDLTGAKTKAEMLAIINGTGN
jgi:hypothetical protein